jgi:hypothetical protein
MVGAVVERLRSPHALSWSAVGVAAAALVVACFVPSLEIAISAFIGAGDDQRGFRYERKLALAFDVGWPGPLALVAGLSLVVAAVTGSWSAAGPGLWSRRSRWPWRWVCSFSTRRISGSPGRNPGRGRLRVASRRSTPAASARRAEGGGPSVAEGPQPRLDADWRRARLLVARTHRVAGLPLVRPSASLADRLQALPAGTRAVSVSLPRGRRDGGVLRLVGRSNPHPTRLTKAGVVMHTIGDQEPALPGDRNEKLVRPVGALVC